MSTKIITDETTEDTEQKTTILTTKEKPDPIEYGISALTICIKEVHSWRKDFLAALDAATIEANTTKVVLTEMKFEDAPSAPSAAPQA